MQHPYPDHSRFSRTFAAAAYIPVGHIIYKVNKQRDYLEQIVLLHLVFNQSDGFMKKRNDPSVKLCTA